MSDASIEPDQADAIGARLRRIEVNTLERCRQATDLLHKRQVDYPTALIAAGLLLETSNRNVLRSKLPVPIKGNWGAWGAGSFVTMVGLLQRFLPTKETEAAVRKLDGHVFDAVAALLHLAAEYHELRKHISMYGRGLVEAAAEADVLRFHDSKGLALGPLTEDIDEFDELSARDGLDAATKKFEDGVHQMVLEWRDEHANRRGALAWWRQLQDRPQPLAALSQWYLEGDGRPFATASAGRAKWMAGWGDYFLTTVGTNLPQVPDDTRVGDISWGDLKRLWFFVYALSLERQLLSNFDAAVKAYAPRWAERKAYITLPVVHDAPSKNSFVGTLLELLVVTDRQSLIALACEITQLPQAAVARVLDALVMRSVDADAIPSDAAVLSNLVRLSNERILMLPLLCSRMTNADKLLKLVQKLDLAAFNGPFAAAHKDAPQEFAALSKQLNDGLLVVVDRQFREGGKLLGDIDLGIYDPKNGFLACFEFKSLWAQSLTEFRANDLTHAAAQLRKIGDYLRADDGARFSKAFDVAKTPLPELRTVIVTRRSYNVFRIDGVPIVTYRGLRKIMRAEKGDLRRVVEQIYSLNLGEGVRAAMKGYELQAKFGKGHDRWTGIGI